MTVLLIVGASRGIGLACVRHALSLANVRVFGVARNEAKLSALADELQKPERFDWLAGDITDRNVCRRAVEHCVKRFGRLDAVIQNAGSLEPLARVADVDVDAYKRSFDINLFSMLELTQAALPELRRNHGAIVLVSTGAASHAYAGWSAYSTSKAAAMMLKLCISVEEPQVTAIGLRPGRVDTDMQAQIREKGKDVMHPDDHQSFVQAKEKGLLVKPEDCARSIVALAVAARDGEWRGAEVSWQDHRVQSLAARVFNDA